MAQTGLSWGNLSSHMSKLEAAGYIGVEKSFVGRRPHTMLRLTEAGRAAFQEYRQRMKQVLDDLPG
jgi:DNA-binding MarR family transcriptional regulator